MWVNVISITSEGVELLKIDTDVAGPDDDEDVLVDNLVKAAGEELLKMSEQIKETVLFLRNSQNLFEKNMQDILNKSLKEIANSVSGHCTRPHVDQSVQTEDHIAGKGSFPTGNTNPSVASDIILEAMHFANKQSIPPSNHAICRTFMSTCIRLYLINSCFCSYILRQDQHASYMDTEELHVGGDVRDVEVTEPNCNVDGEETTYSPTVVLANLFVISMQSEQSIFPQSNSKDTSGDDSTNAGTENQETVVTGLSFPNPSFSIGLTTQQNK
ncbi:hypothetical protein Bca52824_027481 [Brassica carinata]|uniref:Uncharacterized protein n=1 Tax=Brassica carinata TaxID=52824 RepID=A0A8X8AN82_BRACI|nr:hypothetical protein Bca52824_027481 [Brassica carinata]